MAAKEIKKGKTDEKDFAVILDIITTHRSRALMSVNVESLLTYSNDAFLAILAKYSSHLKRYLNFFQSAVGKSSTGIILCRDANRIVVEYAMSRAMSPVMVAQYKRLLIPKEVLQRTFEEYLELPQL